MAEPSENQKPEGAPAANENGFKDKPRPFTIFAIEAKKTNSMLEQTAQERKAVDTKIAALHKAYVPALEAHGLALKQAGEQRISVRKETVEKLAAEVGATQKVIEELQKKLLEEQAKMARSAGALSTATREMETESAKIVKENKASYKAKRGELLNNIATVREERSAVYAKTGKQIRRERWNTFKRTTREAIAFVPDLALRFGKAAKRGAGEIVHIFHRSAKSAKTGFNEPTLFSVTRDKPIVPQQPQPKKPQAPGQ